MCQIIVKPAGKKVDFKKLDKAQKSNSDGYGVTWWDNEELQLQTFKTMKYNRFKAILSTLKDEDAVIHLRNTTKGHTCIDNNHPFEIPSGVMFHNGTINGLSCDAQGGSDTKALADLLNSCRYDYIEDILPLIQEIVGDTINRLVFFEDDGKVTIVNKELGVVEEGIWYSNTYHKKERYTPATKTKDYTYKFDPVSKKWIPADEEPWKKDTNVKKVGGGANHWSGKTVEKYKVFVYGTLKKGFGNNSLLKDSKFLGEATTADRWLMIGKGMGFPYLLKKDKMKGKIIKGELYEVDKNTLNRLDQLEGVPTHYKRVSTSIKCGNTYYYSITYVKADEEPPSWATGLDYIDEFVMKEQSYAS